jgi:diketogulonate reductase-like aldo/keto reductase
MSSSLATSTAKDGTLKNAHLGTLEVSRIGLGAMTMAGTYTSEGALDNAASIRTIHRAFDLGVTHIDTAEIYGPFLSEEIVSDAIRGRRDEVKIATKFGLVSHAGGGPGVIDSSPANVKTAVEGSLKRLGTDHIDLLYQHRVDPNTPIEETAQAVADLIAEGKVLHFGLSEASPETIRRAHAVQPVSALQSEYSLWTRDVEADPAAAARAGNRIRPLLAARSRPAHRTDPFRRRLRRRRLAQVQPPIQRRELPPQPRTRRRGPRDRRGNRRNPRANRARVDPHPGRRHRPDPRHPPRRSRRGEHLG